MNGLVDLLEFLGRYLLERLTGISGVTTRQGFGFLDTFETISPKKEDRLFVGKPFVAIDYTHSASFELIILPSFRKRKSTDLTNRSWPSTKLQIPLDKL